MNLRDRIEALQGWDKEADDILQEIDLTYVLKIPLQSLGKIAIYSSFMTCHNTSREGKIDERKIIKLFLYHTQCQKLRAFKDALLWLAEKAGKLDDKKEELKERIKVLEHQHKNLEGMIIELKDEL